LANYFAKSTRNASNTANAAFIQANLAFDHANAAYNTANTADDYTAANSVIWATSPPTTIYAAIDRLVNLVYTLNSNTPIP